MDTELKSKLIQALDVMGQAVQKGADFTSEQAPLVVQEYVAYEFWTHLGMLLMCTALSIIWVVAGIKLIRKALTIDVDDAPGTVFACVVPVIVTGLFVTGPAFFSIPYNFDRTLKAAVAPRVLVLEKAADLVKDIK